MSFGNEVIQPREFKEVSPILKAKSRLFIRGISKKRARILAEYAKVRHEFLTDHPYCQHFMAENGIDEDVAKNNLGIVLVKQAGEWTYLTVPKATEIHHKKGRGKFMLDVSTFMGVSPQAHEKIHGDPKTSYEKSYMLPRR